MKVFITWSGERSKDAAESLAWWLPKVIQAVDPAISTHNLDSGAVWFRELGKDLSEAQFGVICLTAENLRAPWVLFEAGALWKGLPSNRVCPLLLDITGEDMPTLEPLAQFQWTPANEEGTRNLMYSINKAMRSGGLDEKALNEAFDQWWPSLAERLNQARAVPVSEVQQRQGGAIPEILQLVRGIVYLSSEKGTV